MDNGPKTALYGEMKTGIFPRSDGYFCKPLFLLASPRGFEPLLSPGEIKEQWGEVVS
jgi:hypothetical protein